MLQIWHSSKHLSSALNRLNLYSISIKITQNARNPPGGDLWQIKCQRISHRCYPGQQTKFQSQRTFSGFPASGKRTQRNSSDSVGGPLIEYGTRVRQGRLQEDRYQRGMILKLAGNPENPRNDLART